MMTYKELNDRLAKCESTLEKIKNGSYATNPNTDIKKTTEKLTILRESLQKQIAESEETMFVTNKAGDTKVVKMDRKTAMSLKNDPNVTDIDTAKGQEIKENIEFSIEETKAIAKKVGKAVAIAIKDSGDEINTMKAKRIEPNSFEIYVDYKKDIATDEFSFYITDDTLHLTDFSFDKELVNVGVKPSGEAIVHVDHLANELVKHFKSMNEDEEEDAKNDADYEAGWHDDPRMDEAPEGLYYIKVEKWNKALQNAVQNTIETIYDPVRFTDIVDDDGAGNVIMYFPKEDFDPGMVDDLEGEGVDISRDTNLPIGLNEPHLDEDVDIGHQDDEPNMLQSTAFETAQYAAKLVKKLQKYDNFDGEVDFPNWWQSKLILAKDYMQKAYHYLDSEEKQPAIDQLALENVDKVAGGIPYKREGNKFIITEPLDDATKERIIKRAEEHGHHAAPNMAGGVTIMAKEGVNEAMSSEQKEAIYDLQNILDRAAQLGDEARQIVKDNFPNELSAGDAYDVFSFGTSSNSYDKTLETLISDIERTAEEEDMDMDEGVNEGTELYDRNGINIKRFSGGQKGLMVQISYGGDYLQVPADVFPILAIAMQSVKNDLKDMSRQVPRSKNMDEGIAKTQKAHGLVVAKMKELAKQFKAGDKSVVAQLKDLTAKKKQLEKQLEKDVAGKNRGQQLDTGINEYRGVQDDLINIIKDKAEDSGFSHEEETEEVIEFLQGIEFDDNGSIAAVYEKVTKEAAPGFKHDCAAKVVHEKYGEGNTIPERHTLVKEGSKYVVTHYDVLFESGKTVKDIPVSELDIKTSNEHWHKGYKKKKK